MQESGTTGGSIAKNENKSYFTKARKQEIYRIYCQILITAQKYRINEVRDAGTNQKK